MKLFVNRATLDFDDALDIEPTQLLQLKASDYGKDVVTKLKVAKFTAVNSLFVFAECETSEKVALSKIGFVGLPVQGTSDMNKLKKVGEDEGGE